MASRVRPIISRINQKHNGQTETLPLNGSGHELDLETDLDMITQNPSDIGHSVKIVKLTPELAAKWYATKPEKQRKHRNSQVEKLTRDIKAGRWKINGEAITFDRKGRMVQGQHRCLAVMRAGLAIWVYVIWGVDENIGSSYDNTSVRTAADSLAADGHVNTNELAAAARKAMYFEMSGSGNHLTLTNSEVQAWVAANPGIKDSVRRCSPIKRFSFSISMTTVAAMHFFFCKKSEESADNFVGKLISGENLQAKSPILQLRNRMGVRDIKATTTEQMGLIIKAWNAYRTGQIMSQLKWTRHTANGSFKQESMPEIA